MTRNGITLGVLFFLLGYGGADAATLDHETCTKLRTEVLQLELAGARSNMAKGPDWAKVNLAANKLEQIKRLIEVDELLLFRCQGKPLVALPESVDAEPSPPADGKDGAEEAKAGNGKAASKEAAKPAAKSPAKSAAQPADKAAGGPAAAKPANKAGAGKVAAEPSASPTPPKPKPKPKPKVDDAYKPPPVPPGTDPFAGQK